MAESKRFSDLPYSDVTCDGCGYCLRGRSLTDLCSECGMAVMESAARVADRKLSSGDASGENSSFRRSDLRWGPWLILFAGCIFYASLQFDEQKSMSPYRLPMQLIADCFTTVGVFICTRLTLGASEPMVIHVLRLLTRISVAIYMASRLAELTFGLYHGSGLFSWLGFRNEIFSNQLATVGTAFLFVYLGWIASIKGRIELAAVAIFVATISLAIVVMSFDGSRSLYSGGGNPRPLPGIGFGVGAINSGYRITLGWGAFAPSLWGQAAFAILYSLRTGMGWASIILLVQFGLMTRREKKIAALAEKPRD